MVWLDIAILMKTKSSVLTLTSTDDLGFVNFGTHEPPLS